MMHDIAYLRDRLMTKTDTDVRDEVVSILELISILDSRIERLESKEDDSD